MADMEQEEAAAESAPQSKLQSLRNQINDVTDHMKKNLEILLERYLKAENLLEKTEEMERGAEQFKKTGERVQTSYRCKNIKLTVAIVVIVLIVVLIIILLAIGVIPISVPAKKSENTGKTLKTSYRCKNIKLTVAIVVIVLIVVLIIILLAIPISVPVTPTASPTSKP